MILEKPTRLKSSIDRRLVLETRLNSYGNAKLLDMILKVFGECWFAIYFMYFSLNIDNKEEYRSTIISTLINFILNENPTDSLLDEILYKEDAEMVKSWKEQ